jgi:ribosome biogenesis GTPase / thiamine phosphate phosphatase
MRSGAESRRARVISVGRDTAWIVFDGEAVARPASLPKRQERLSVVPGDEVLARDIDADRAVVDRVLERSFALVRRTAGGRSTTMAANVDTLAVVAALERPTLNVAMVDEIVAFGELHERRIVLIFTKPDLVDAAQREHLTALYRSLGYPTFAINPKVGTGVDEVERALSGHASLLIGQSGAGKSSLFRSLGGAATVGDVSRLGRGRQTTTMARLHRFPAGFLVDSPGVSEFALHPAGRRPGYEWFAEVAHGFVEFAPLVPRCRFTDCTHRTEPDCAVRAATDSGTVARSRYESYLLIVARELPPS